MPQTALPQSVGPRPKRTAVWVHAMVALMLLIHAVLGLTASLNKSMGFDEPIHLASGMSYWVYNDYRLQPENGNLPQRLEALPAYLFASNTFPKPDADGWPTSRMFTIARTWTTDLKDQLATVVLSARMTVMALSVLLGLTVFLWSRKLFGDAGGLVSLALYAFSPTMLTQGVLITSDIASALFFLWSAGAVWWLVQRITPGRIAVLGLAAGGLALSKFSAPLLIIIAALLVIIRVAGPIPLKVGWSRTPIAIFPARTPATFFLPVLAVGASALVVVGLIWMSFDFRFDSNSNMLPKMEHHHIDWDVLITPPTFVKSIVLEARAYHLLPDAYLYGQMFVLRASEARRAFWCGEVSDEGWRLFFPSNFLLKTPLSTLALLLAAFGAWYVFVARTLRKPWTCFLGFYRTAPIWVLLWVYWAAAISSHLNLGHRHLLPIYPPTFILAGASAWWISRSHRIARTFVYALVALAIIETLLVFPNYFSYFNPLIGSRSNAHNYFVDSSLDWGQELPSIHQWIEADRRKSPSADPVYLSYFGSVDPRIYSIEPIFLNSYLDFDPDPNTLSPLRPGIYIISATNLQNLYTEFYGYWNPDFENAYQQMNTIIAPILKLPPDSPQRTAFMLEKGPNFCNLAIRKYKDLRFGRLTAYLRNRKPDDMINYSVLVYRLSKDDLEKALNGPPEPLFDPASQ